MAQEWKTFSAENRDATTGSGSSGKPWVNMHHFGEFTSTTRTESDLVGLSVKITFCIKS